MCSFPYDLQTEMCNKPTWLDLAKQANILVLKNTLWNAITKHDYIFIKVIAHVPTPAFPQCK